ncbi:MAG: glycosyltransferase [Acidobacteriota bacterium]
MPARLLLRLLRGMRACGHNRHAMPPVAQTVPERWPPPTIPEKNPHPEVSVVIPVFNEEESLPLLHRRLHSVLLGTGKSYEIIYVDDGSSDGSLAYLKEKAAASPQVQVVELTRNCGQHPAILAGFSQSRAGIVVTLDADLQNPPEEIPRLLAAVEEGHDVVGGVRHRRQDPVGRTLPSKLINRIIRRSTGAGIHDFGCMLRAYRREVVEQVVVHGGSTTFIPALANLLAHSPAEIPVDHAPRTAGRSKYGLGRLFNLAFDLVTGYSLFPIKMVAFMGGLISVSGLGLGGFLLVRRLLVGPEAEGLFTLLAILFVFVGFQVLALGLIGEYVGRIYFEVRKRPCYSIRQVHRIRD